MIVNPWIIVSNNLNKMVIKPIKSIFTQLLCLLYNSKHICSKVLYIWQPAALFLTHIQYMQCQWSCSLYSRSNLMLHDMRRFLKITKWSFFVIQLFEKIKEIAIPDPFKYGSDTPKLNIYKAHSTSSNRRQCSYKCTQPRWYHWRIGSAVGQVILKAKHTHICERSLTLTFILNSWRFGSMLEQKDEWSSLWRIHAIQTHVCRLALLR